MLSKIISGWVFFSNRRARVGSGGLARCGFCEGGPKTDRAYQFLRPVITLGIPPAGWPWGGKFNHAIDNVRRGSAKIANIYFSLIKWHIVPFFKIGVKIPVFYACFRNRGKNPEFLRMFLDSGKNRDKNLLKIPGVWTVFPINCQIRWHIGCK